MIGPGKPVLKTEGFHESYLTHAFHQGPCRSSDDSDKQLSKALAWNIWQMCRLFSFVWSGTMQTTACQVVLLPREGN